MFTLPLIVDAGLPAPAAIAGSWNALKGQWLMATVFHVLGLPQELHYKDQSGRPVPMINGGKPIAELV